MEGEIALTIVSLCEPGLLDAALSLLMPLRTVEDVFGAHHYVFFWRYHFLTSAHVLPGKSMLYRATSYPLAHAG
jgi:hypothetical protein